MIKVIYIKVVVRWLKYFTDLLNQDIVDQIHNARIIYETAQPFIEHANYKAGGPTLWSKIYKLIRLIYR